MYENADGPMLMPKGSEWKIHLLLSVMNAVFSAVSLLSLI